MIMPEQHYIYNFRLYRKWVEGDNEALKEIAEEYEKFMLVKRKKKLSKISSNMEVGKSLLMDLNMEGFKTHYVQNRNMNKRTKMQKYLNKVIKRITIILRCQKKFKIKIDKKVLDLSAFIEPFFLKAKMEVIQESENVTEMSADFIECMLPYINFPCFFDE